MTTKGTQRTVTPGPDPCNNRAWTASRGILFTLLSMLLALILSACAANPAAMDEALPAMPLAGEDGPPPGIRMLVDGERMALLGSAVGAAVQAASASATATEEAAAVTPTPTAATDEESDSSPAEATSATPEVEESAPASDDEAAPVEPAEAAEETAVAVEVEPEPAIVTVSNRSVNVRSGPGLNYTVVAGARQGDTFDVIGRSPDEGWWRICCVQGANDGPEEATQRAWISNIVVEPNQVALAKPVLEPLFDDDLEAAWTVDYTCGSDRCEVTSCQAGITLDVRNASDPLWLELERQVTWDDDCGEDSTWLHQVDRLEGRERYDNTSDLFLFNFWAGVDPGPINSLFSLDSERQVKTWCSDEQELELEEGDGWTTVYTGTTCHDVRTGMLVSMKYTKRWFFTGTFEDEVYEEAYFGDYEIYEVRLDDTTVDLSYVNPPEPES